MAYSNRTPFQHILMKNLQIEHWICDTSKIYIMIFGESEYQKRFFK